MSFAVQNQQFSTQTVCVGESERPINIDRVRYKFETRNPHSEPMIP